MNIHVWAKYDDILLSSLKIILFKNCPNFSKIDEKFWWHLESTNIFLQERLYYTVGHIQPCRNFAQYNKIISSHPIATVPMTS